MNLLFADTFYFLALLNQEDAAHNKARAISEERSDPIITTAWVLTEVADALAAPKLRPVFLRLMEALRSDPNTTIVPPTQTLFEHALTLYAERPDQDWTLTDCISFVVMRQHDVNQALTGDRHFEPAGLFAVVAVLSWSLPRRNHAAAGAAGRSSELLVTPDERARPRAREAGAA